MENLKKSYFLLREQYWYLLGNKKTLVSLSLLREERGKQIQMLIWHDPEVTFFLSLWLTKAVEYHRSNCCFLFLQTMEVNDFTSTVACFMRLSWAAAAGRLDLVGSSQPIKESNTLFSAGIRNRLSSSGRLTESLNQSKESICFFLNWTLWKLEAEFIGVALRRSSWAPSNSGYYMIKLHKSEENAVHSSDI